MPTSGAPWLNTHLTPTDPRSTSYSAPSASGPTDPTKAGWPPSDARPTAVLAADPPAIWRQSPTSAAILAIRPRRRESSPPARHRPPASSACRRGRPGRRSRARGRQRRPPVRRARHPRHPARRRRSRSGTSLDRSSVNPTPRPVRLHTTNLDVRGFEHRREGLPAPPRRRPDPLRAHRRARSGHSDVSGPCAGGHRRDFGYATRSSATPRISRSRTPG